MADYDINRCRSNECELAVKKKTREESLKYAEKDPTILTGAVKTLNVPYGSEPLAEGEKCFMCGKPAACRALWGRTY